MLKIEKELIEKIQEIDKRLTNKYLYSYNDKANIRQKIQDKLKPIRQMAKLKVDNLSNWLEKKQIGAVDGSVNASKGEGIYTLYFFQGLAKTLSGNECRRFDIYCPLVEEGDQEESKMIRTKRMSSLELLVAKQLMEEENIKVLLMDGSLTHYDIESPKEWKALKEIALEKNVLLAGISEAVGTKQIIKLDEEWEDKFPLDRDLLFGLLEQGEMLYAKGVQAKKNVHNAWLRPSSSPAVIGVDMLNEQKDYMEELCDLIYTLTPKEGRGIPLFLDMVDKEVRITDKLVEVLIEQYITPEMRQRFFTPKRTERIY